MGGFAFRAKSRSMTPILPSFTVVTDVLGDWPVQAYGITLRHDT